MRCLRFRIAVRERRYPRELLFLLVSRSRCARAFTTTAHSLFTRVYIPRTHALPNALRVLTSPNPSPRVVRYFDYSVPRAIALYYTSIPLLPIIARFNMKSLKQVVVCPGGWRRQISRSKSILTLSYADCNSITSIQVQPAAMACGVCDMATSVPTLRWNPSA